MQDAGEERNSFFRRTQQRWVVGRVRLDTKTLGCGCLALIVASCLVIGVLARREANSILEKLTSKALFDALPSSAEDVKVGGATGGRFFGQGEAIAFNMNHSEFAEWLSGCSATEMEKRHVRLLGKAKWRYTPRVTDSVTIYTYNYALGTNEWGIDEAQHITIIMQPVLDPRRIGIKLIVWDVYAGDTTPPHDLLGDLSLP